MEEVIKHFKNEFSKKGYEETRYKLCFAIGYLEDCEKVTKKEAMQILWKIMQNKI